MRGTYVLFRPLLNRAQVAPASVLLRTPPFVAAQTVPGVTARELTNSAEIAPAGCQLAAPFVVFQMVPGMSELPELRPEYIVVPSPASDVGKIVPLPRPLLVFVQLWPSVVLS